MSPKSASKGSTSIAPTQPNKQVEATLRQLKSASTAVISTASHSLSFTKQLDSIGSLFARINILYVALPKEAFQLVAKIVDHVASVELPSLRALAGGAEGEGRKEAREGKKEAWEGLIEKILRSLKTFAQATDTIGKQGLGKECFSALVDLFQKCDSVMVKRRILDVFDAGIQGGVVANKLLLVKNSQFVDITGRIFAEASDHGLVERCLDNTVRIVKATPTDWTPIIFDASYYSGGTVERDFVQREFEKIDLKNYDQKVAAFMTALSRRNLANFQPIFILRLAANNKTLTNCDGEADGKVVTFGSTAHFNAKSFTVVTTKEIGEDMLQQILEVEYPFKRLVIDIIDNKTAAITILADRIKLDSRILVPPVNQTGSSTVAFTIRSKDVDSLKKILTARELAYEIRGKVTSVISPVVPAKRSTETPVMSIKGEQDRKIAPDRVVQASKSTTEAISSKAAIKSKSPAKSAPSKVKLAPETVPNPAAVLRPVTPQRTVQFSSPALQAGRASADFVYPISTQRRAFLTAGVESSPSSSDPILVVRPIVPSQNQLSIRSSQVVVHQKPRSEQKRARASASQVVSVKKQKKGHRVSRARIEEVEDETEDRLSAALEDLFTMISKSVGKTSIRTRKMKSAFQTSSTRKATEIEQQNHRQTGLILQRMQEMLGGIHDSRNHAMQEMYEMVDLMGEKENGRGV